MSEITGSLRILLVDDDEVDRKAVQRELRRAGLDIVVSEASHPDDAMQELRGEPFDCVFLDYNLPGADGLQVLRAIRQLPDPPPVVALTGHGDELVAAELIKSGAVDYLSKNRMSPERLAQAIRNALRVDAAETEARRAMRKLQVLAETSSALSVSLDLNVTLTNLAQLMVRSMCDYCLIYLSRPDGSIDRGGSAHRKPELEPVVARLLESYMPALGDEHSYIAQVLESGEPILVQEIPVEIFDFPSFSEEARSALRELDPKSLLVVPLIARQRSFGALALVCQSGDLDQEDLTLASQVASRAAIAADNAMLYQEAQDAIRARDDVVAVVSHDLRNPLNVIYNGATLVLDLPLEPADQRKQLEAIRRSADQMNRLIEDLLDVTRLEAGSFSIETSLQSAGSLIGEACELIRPIAERKRINLDCRAPDELPKLRVDRERILQVLGNLLGNALKFTPDDGTVVVDAQVERNAVRFSVQDSGPGIPPDDLAFLFDRFYQVQRSGRSRQGSGLGLAIAKGIVEAHGGRIWADSTVGAGTTLHFTIPVAVVPNEVPVPA